SPQPTRAERRAHIARRQCISSERAFSGRRKRAADGARRGAAVATATSTVAPGALALAPLGVEMARPRVPAQTNFADRRGGAVARGLLLARRTRFRHD